MTDHARSNSTIEMNLPDLPAATPTPPRHPIRLWRQRVRIAALVLCTGASWFPRAATGATEEPLITAVAAKVSPDYVRAKLPNGSFAPEVYAFGEGGVWGGAMADASSDKLKFRDVARTIVRPLLAQNYLSAQDPAKTNLLIMVYWGTTAGTSGVSNSVAYQNLSASQSATGQLSGSAPRVGARTPGTITASFGGGLSSSDEAAMDQVIMTNRLRDLSDVHNAGILGYDEVQAHIGNEFGRTLGTSVLHMRDEDLVEEIEHNRYFVVLMAYDFQLLWKEKKHKLLWETRFSVEQRGNDFDKQLEAMAQFASRYFGRDSHGLVRKPMPIESVRLDEMKILGVVPDK